MDSLALRAVLCGEERSDGPDSDDLSPVRRRPRGARRRHTTRQAAAVTPRRARGGSLADPTTGEGSLVMDDRYAYGPDDDADAEDTADCTARRAVQVAMDRRDNGGRS